MKKLLSAVTSFVMAASVMTSAFASSVSAAGRISAAQPNVSIGGVSDVSANTTASNANFTVDFGTYSNVKPGSDIIVTAKITNNGNSQKIGGVDVNFKADSPLKISEIDESSDAFPQATVKTNINKFNASIISLDSSGEPTAPKSGETLFTLLVNVPANIDTSKDYTIGFGDKLEFYKSGQGSEQWTVNEVKGVISFGNATTSTTVTSQNPVGGGDFTVDFGSYKATPGETVLVSAKIKSSNTSNKIGGIDVNFKLDSPLKLSEIDEASDAFPKSTVKTNAEGLKASIITLDGSDPTAPKNGETLFLFSVEVPSNIDTSKTYEVGFGNKVEFYKQGVNSEKWSVNEIKGQIYFGDAPSTTTTTTTTKTPSGNGDFTVDFGTYSAKPGETVLVSAKIKSKNTSNKIGGIDVNFALDSPLTISEMDEASEAFPKATVKSNLDELKASIITLDGSEPTAPKNGETLFFFAVEIPANIDTSKTYEVGFGNKVEFYKQGANSEKWAVDQIKGQIYFGDAPSSSTTTSTTTSSTPSGNGDFTVDFGTYSAKPGETVLVSAKIKSKNTSNKIGGIDVNFALDSPLTISEMDEASEAFPKATVKSNLDELKASIITLDGSEPTAPKNGETLFYFAVEIPANIDTSKTYEVGFGNKVEFYKQGANSEKWAVDQIKGQIYFGDAPSSSTTTSTTTSSTPSGNGDFTVDFGTYTAKPGETVLVSAKIKSKNTSNKIGGIDVNFALDSPLTISEMDEASEAFPKATVKSNLDELKASIITLDGSEPTAPKNGETLFYFAVEIPANIDTSKTYEVGFGNKVEFYKQGANSEKWAVDQIKGVIKFETETTSTTSTTTTSTTSSSTTTSSTTSSAIPAAGSVKWVIPTVNAMPGETVTMNVVVEDSDLEVAGAQFVIKADTGVNYSSATGAPAYNSTLVANDKTQQFAFGQGQGLGTKAADGSTVLKLTYTVPAGCTPGTYNVKWSNAFICDTNGSDITSKVQLVDGAIKVGALGDISWVLDKVTAAPGETVTLKAVISDTKNTKLPIAGAQFSIKPDGKIDYSSISGTSEAYGAAIVANGKTQQFAFADAKGASVESVNGKTVLSITYKIDENCAEGEYPVVWSDAFISDTNGSDITDQITLVNGLITVKKIDTTKGTLTWDIPEVEAAPGETVALNVVVKDSTDPALGVAGAQFVIKNADGVVYDSISGSEGYKASIVANDKTQQFAFAEEIGKDVTAKDNDSVFVISYKVPDDCAENTYPITWDNVFITDTDGNDITANVKLEPGSITVKKPVVPQKGKIIWQLDTVTAKPGDTVTINMVVIDETGANIEVAGAQFDINETSPISYVSVSEASEAYGDAIVANGKTKQFAFADAEGLQQAAANGAKVLTLTYKVPEGTTKGKYPIVISNLFVSSTDGEDITDKIDTINGAIIIEEAETTTSSTDTTTSSSTDTTTSSSTDTTTSSSTDTTTSSSTDTTTSSSTDTTTSSSTDTTTSSSTDTTTSSSTDTTTSSSTDTTTSSSTDTTTSSSTDTTTSSSTDTTTSSSTDTTTSSSTDTTTSSSTDTTTSSSTDTTTSSSTDTTTSSSTDTTTSSSTDTTTSSSTDTTTSSSTDTTTSSSTDTTTSSSTDTTTSSTETTPTTTVSVRPGAILWKLDTVTAKPGETVKINMVVNDPYDSKLPVAAAQFNIKPGMAIDLVEVSEISEAYGAAIQSNGTTRQFAFANAEGVEVASENGKIVLTLTYTIPEDCEDGTIIPLSITDLFVSSGDGAEITSSVLTQDGMIIVRAPQTTTSTDTTTSSSTDTTTSSSTDTTTSSSTDTTTSSSTDTTTSSSTDTTTSSSTDTTTSSSTDTTTSSSTDTTTSSSTDTTTSSSTDTTTSSSTDTTTSSSTDTTTSSSTDTTTSSSTDTTTSSSTDTTTSSSTDTTTSSSTDTTTSSSTDTTTSSSTDTTTSSSTDTTTSSSTTSSDDTTTSTTTSTPIPQNGVGWQGETVRAKQGDEITLAIKVVDPFGSKLAIGGAQFGLDFDADKLEFIGVEGGSNGYNAQVVYNPQTGMLEFANPSGFASIAANGDNVVVLKFKVKDDCPNGTYNVAVKDLYVADKDGNDITKLVVATPGKVIVNGKGELPFEGDVYAEVTKTHGFYFSHDNGTRNNGQKGGFSPNQITSLKLFTRTSDNGIISSTPWAEEDIDMSLINFGDAVPMSVYDENNKTFKYEVPVFYGQNRLVDRDGVQITVTVYIGVKGDIDLDGKVLAYDASLALTFYTKSQKQKPETIQLSTNPAITGADDVLDDFCAFLGDVDANEWDPDNWKLTKADRKILANDASGILTFYTLSQKPENNDSQVLWDKIVPERFGN